MARFRSEALEPTMKDLDIRISRLRADPAFASLRRSLDVYYGDAPRDAAMDELYATLLKPGGLAFDIGSHVGDRIGSFRRCGARVVALEPQPLCARVIREIYAGDGDVTLVEAACGPKPGTLMLHINSANPTVTTASADFVKAADGAGGWEGQVWDRAIEVPVTTLDELIAAHGRPDFVKIDVEGFEADVLAGLSRALPCLSFEFTTIQREVAYQCLDRLAALGPYGFDIALGESQRLTFGRWVRKAEMAEHIRSLPHAANSGDVYAVLG
jgi:FkbM family methyltransferase